MDIEEIFSGGVTPSKWVALGRYLRKARIVAGVGVRLASQNESGTILSATRRTGETAVASTSCPFGEIIRYTDEGGEGEEPTQKTGIRGGNLHVGDKNFVMDPQSLNLEASGEWLVSLKVECTSNRDDDNEIILPGIKTGIKPTGDWNKTAYTVGTDYPDNVQPVVATGAGTIYVPIGLLKITGGAASLSGTSCGAITITQCGGVLGYTRGDAE